MTLILDIIMPLACHKKYWCVVSSYINWIWNILLIFTSQTVLDLLELFPNGSKSAKYLDELLVFLLWVYVLHYI